MADWQPSNIVDFKNCSYVLVTKTVTEATKSIIRCDRKLCDPQMCLNSWFIDVFWAEKEWQPFWGFTVVALLQCSILFYLCFITNAAI